MVLDEKDLLPASVLALVIFEAWRIYENNAPSLATCRAASDPTEKSDVTTQLNDADLAVGGMILLTSGVFAYYTKKPVVLVMSGILLVGLSGFRRYVIDSPSTHLPR